MGISLGFHIVFACIGMTMPWLMAIASYRWHRSREPLARQLAQAWAKGVAVFFAVGAVSGTVLSLELGMLWPTFMEHAGPIIGLPFSWEGTAFFIEAIALGLFLYGWDRLPEWVHFGSGVVVGLSGVLSGVLVVAANAWMNSPRGFRWVDGHAVDVDPVAAMFNDTWAAQALHMVLAAFVATCFGVAGLHAYRLLCEPGSRFHQRALRVALMLGSVCALLQPLSGDLSAKDVARRQPIKLAAMEAHYHTERAASLLIGGYPDDASQTVRFGIELPYLLSVLAFADPHAEVMGLDRVPRDMWPNTAVCHLAFQVMVGCGSLLMALGVWFLFLHIRRRKQPFPRLFLRATTLAAPLGFVAVEAGWTVTEVGRQPWIIYGVLRTKDAVTPMPGLLWPLLTMLVVYALLVFVTVAVLKRLVAATERSIALGYALPGLHADEPPAATPVEAPHA